MGIFDFFKGTDINKELKVYEETAGAVLLDVRTPEEYKMGHIPNSIHIPLQTIAKVEGVIKDKHTPVFVYCRSGNRSGQAMNLMQKMGYTNVKNIGGIVAYKGKIEK